MGGSKMHRFVVCLFPALFFWWTPIVTILPFLEARTVTAAPTSHVPNDVPTFVPPNHSNSTDIGTSPTTAFSQRLCDELDNFVNNFTIDNSSATSATPVQPAQKSNDLPLPIVVIISIIMVVYSIVGTIGNGLVILAFCMYREVRTSAHTFIVSSSVSDILLTGLQYPTIIPSIITGAPSLGQAMCPILGALLFFSVYVSLFSVMLIAFNRCMHITKSTDTYRMLFSPLKSFLWVLLSWVVSGVLVAPGFLGYGEFGWGAYQICGIRPDNPYSPYYMTNVLGLCYLLVFCVVALIYLRIYFFVKNSVITVAAANPNLLNHEQYVSRRVIKQTKHMFVIFCAFTLSTAPCALLYNININRPFLPSAVTIMLIVLYYLNHVMNPFLYAWKLRVFRRAFKALIRCKRHLPFQPGAAVNYQ